MKVRVAKSWSKLDCWTRTHMCCAMSMSLGLSPLFRGFYPAPPSSFPSSAKNNNSTLIRPWTKVKFGSELLWNKVITKLHYCKLFLLMIFPYNSRLPGLRLSCDIVIATIVMTNWMKYDVLIYNEKYKRAISNKTHAINKLSIHNNYSYHYISNVTIL
jgi:hypothetical protein